jgi:hypothetical protein
LAGRFEGGLPKKRQSQARVAYGRLDGFVCSEVRSLK